MSGKLKKQLNQWVEDNCSTCTRYGSEYDSKLRYTVDSAETVPILEEAAEKYKHVPEIKIRRYAEGYTIHVRELWGWKTDRIPQKNPYEIVTHFIMEYTDEAGTPQHREYKGENNARKHFEEIGHEVWGEVTRLALRGITVTLNDKYSENEWTEAEVYEPLPKEAMLRNITETEYRDLMEMDAYALGFIGYEMLHEVAFEDGAAYREMLDEEQK